MSTDIGPIQPTVRVMPTRQPGAEDGASRQTASDSATAAVAHSDAWQLSTSPPVDAERVALIRHAIATGSYPILPMQVADAIIAAGVMLSASK